MAGHPTRVAGRWVRRALASGRTPPTAVRLKMHGEIRIGRWLPFVAEQTLEPPHRFRWSATVRRGPMRISDFDRYQRGEGAQRWSPFGLVPIVRASGPDVSRSARGRLAVESVLTPGALLGDEVAWDDEDDDRAGARLEIDGEPYDVHLDLDPSGQLLAASVDRWGDPGDGSWRLLPFGALFEEERTFDGITIPSRGWVGWWLGTERWPEGEFFRFEIDDASFEAGPAPA